MSAGPTRPATIPPPGLPGLDPAWSRLVEVPGAGTWHVLERPAAGEPELTVIAVHGNPTWSYLWRRLLAAAPTTWRVIAPDQAGMGYSERLGDDGPRRLAQRVADLGALTEALGARGPVVTVAHDWGGPVSLGWVLEHRADVRGIVLTNTAVHQPAGAPAPSLIRLARAKPILRAVTEQTGTFVRGTTLLSSPALRATRAMDPRVAAAFAAPYDDPAARIAVRDFVADIPLEPDHPTAPALDAIAEGVRHLDGVPVLLAWGSDDPVFSDRYLRDLLERMPHADVHRYERARHLVTEDAETCVDDIVRWIGAVGSADAAAAPEPDAPSAAAIGAALRERADDAGVAVADLRGGRTVSWSLLALRTREIAAGLAELGVRPGDRIAMLVPPGPDLIATVYAAWQIGAVVVAADSGLGVRGMRRALRSAAPDHVVGIPAGIALARTIGIPGRHVVVAGARVPGAHATLADVARMGREIGADAASPEHAGDAVIAFTSGATGPPKGVVYTHSRLLALRDALRAAYGISSGSSADALVAAFPPWALLGPALGIASAIPDMDLTDASTLTAATAGRAAAAVGGTLMWTSPTALRAILQTADAAGSAEIAALRGLRVLLAAGAPVPADLLAQAQDLLPGALIATPYGMTEALPLTEVRLEELLAADQRDGVLVGRPLDGVRIGLAPLDALGRPAGTESEADLVTDPGVTGEIIVNCAWMRSRYDRRWATQLHADSPRGWHRTADVGHLDADGRLWVEGRLAHVIATPRGPVTPVGPEMVAQAVCGVARAACVGVGPRGTQAVVIVLEEGGARGLELVDVDTTIGVRRAVLSECGVEVAAVLRTGALPVDIRHRSKIDRAAVARDAARLLAGDLEPDGG
ncbi:MAG: alpha/beta fold hydrolase [bacterium]